MPASEPGRDVGEGRRERASAMTMEGWAFAEAAEGMWTMVTGSRMR
jgi:hypothetical protein